MCECNNLFKMNVNDFHKGCLPGKVEGSGDEPRLPGLFPTECEAEYWSQEGLFKEQLCDRNVSSGTNYKMILSTGSNIHFVFKEGYMFLYVCHTVITVSEGYSVRAAFRCTQTQRGSAGGSGVSVCCAASPRLILSCSSSDSVLPTDDSAGRELKHHRVPYDNIFRLIYRTAGMFSFLKSPNFDSS